MSERYEFTTDWFSHNISIWSRMLTNIAGQENLRVLEIGSYEGRSAVWLLENICTHPSGRLTCVDLWREPAVLARFQRNMEHTGRADQVELVREPSFRFLTRLISTGRPPLFDIIYVDGSHEGRNCLEDGLLAMRVLKTEGILIFDDYRWTGEGYQQHHTPGPAIDAFLTLHDYCTVTLHKAYQVAVRKTGAI